MSLRELLSSNIKQDLAEEISSLDLSQCSKEELQGLSAWAKTVRERADYCTTHGKVVGHTYSNLRALEGKTKQLAKSM